MKTLELRKNKIERIENISHMSKLEALNLGDNHISKISGLEGLTRLKRLFMNKNRLKEIDGGLESQKNSLKHLHV